MNEKPGHTEKEHDKKRVSTILAQTFSKDRIDSSLKIIGVFFTLITIFFTYLTYNAAQKWKTAEFTISKFKEFSENPSVKLVNELFNYNSRSIPLLSKDTLTTITDDVLKSSLIIDSLNSDFSKAEVEIRVIFNDYFNQLSLFNRYSKANLISFEQIRPYLESQVRIVADTTNTRKDNILRHRIWDYINFYGYKDVTELYGNFGFKIK